MAFSLSLLRHRIAAARAQSRGGADLAGDRPAGRLIWAHFGPDIDPLGARLALGRVQAANSDVSILSTGRDADLPGPADTSAAAARFLDHWRPDIALFVGTDPYPRLWSEAQRRGLPLIAAETRTLRQPTPLVRGLAAFDAVIAAEADPRLGPAGQALGHLSTIPAPPGVEVRALERMKEALVTRPLWLALDVPEAEIGTVLSAHATAAHLSHRLVLILSPRAGAEAAAADAVAAQGHRAVCRSRDEMPGTEDPVLLADRPEEAGIWLRLAPLTYLGGTLAGPGPETSPFAPVSLGSALIHGPRTAAAEAALQRLHAGGAVRRVSEAAGLATEVDRLMNPETAAQLARAGWAVTSQGAEASARLVEVIDDTLAGIDA